MFLSLHRPIFSLFRFSSQFCRRFISLTFSTSSSMADDQLLDDVDCNDVPHAFLCCVCLDLLHKPIVLSCGHISCFWCVHKSMSGFRESHCPICRHPYYHFPTICEMLHLLILKIFPVAYKKRENQILEEEKIMGYFSPQFDALACDSQAGKKVEHSEDSANGELKTNTNNDKVVAERILEENSAVVGPYGQKTQNHEKVSVADLLCRACTQLLFRPVVLNCGHALCESCINLQVETLKCQVCECLQPSGFPNVCLMLDQFLKEQFPEEYSLRRDSVQLKLANIFKRSDERGKKGEDLSRSGEVASKVHYGAGCDSCGMCPIVGDRYKCKDCYEKIGFDLCGDCYNTCSKRPGRFNQQHRPEHNFELIGPSNVMFPNLMLEVVTGMLEEGPNDDGSETSEDMGGVLDSSSDAHENDEVDSDARTRANSNDNRTDQFDSNPT
ncbi:E3 ubiquitin-protein ligase PRT1 isoform X2 [Momordica charantia]|uniref:E3 ubiquitin-protein ligase PRT1 isoform X2 n=1 Tax=Momordica charantia TaxID=3673 RepID=A0A6J1D4D0_MOMCH|nr:E3 ubiquitin-protein ligase PRT1 isoform X2 [Momordica charantia]